MLPFDDGRDLIAFLGSLSLESVVDPTLAEAPAGRILQGLLSCPHFPGAGAMTITVEATYENGVLRPAQPLPFKEHARVEITIKGAPSRVRQTAGLIGWTGSQEDADFVALSPELDSLEGT